MSDDSMQDPASTPPDVKMIDAGPSSRRWAFVVTFAGFAALAYICDQLTKIWVTSTMVEGQKTPVIDGLLQWYFIRNPGAAFSIGENFTWLFTLIMAAVAVFIVVIARRIGSVWWAIGLGLLLGGALGNLTDRLFRPPSFAMGHVVDFISFPNFAIFNMADMGVVGGVITICILTLVGVPLNGKKNATVADATPTSVTDPEAGTDND